MDLVRAPARSSASPPRQTHRQWRTLGVWAPVVTGVMMLATLWVCSPSGETLHGASVPHVTITDRGNALLGVVRTSDGTLHEPLTTNDLGPYIEPCLLAAEDKRYYWHPGVDPLALARAVAQAVRHGRAVS